ncbi:DUF3267 domain-containing protein [Anaerolineales bacterium HSG24]|nr:DUF3267 domain-containing protein [Anaerolineales bacterium HSG24]
MNNQQTKPSQQSFLHKLGGYYLIPHELLHVLAFRIIGKPCRYEWGNDYVRPLVKESKRERLFVSLFPFVTIMGLGLIFGLMWISSAFFINIRPERYFIDGPTWHVVFLILCALFIFYSGTAHGDLFSSYYILFGQDEIQDNRPKPNCSPNNKQHQGQ